MSKGVFEFYRRHSALVGKYVVSLKTFLQQGTSGPELNGDLVYIFINILGKPKFSEQFRRLINRYKRIVCSLHIMCQTAGLVFNPITVDGYSLLFNCTTQARPLNEASTNWLGLDMFFGLVCRGSAIAFL